MFKTFQPLYDKVLVARIEAEEKTAGGIILAEAAKEKPTAGIVIAVGEGRLLNDGAIKPLSVNVDDKVYFGKYAGVEIEQDLLVLREDEILGVLK